MYDMLTSQFNDAIAREGKIIYSSNGNTSYTCLFRINSDKNGTKDRTTIYYPVSSNLTQGQLLKFKNDYYIVLNQETAENEVYYKSDLLKVNTEINVIVNGYEIYVKCYADDLQAVNLITNTMITTIGGNIELLAEDNADSRKLSIGSEFVALGATWKIVNLYYKSGLCYTYAERTPSSSTTTSYTISVNAADTYNINDTALLTATAKANDIIINNATITWASSDQSIATISSTGQITCLAEGEVTISATWIEHDITEIKTISVAEDVPSVIYTASITYTLDPVIKAGGSAKTFTAVFKDQTGAVVTLTPVWSFTFPSTITNQITISAQADMYIKLKCADDTKMIGKSFQLNLSDSNNLCSTSLTVNIVSL